MSALKKRRRIGLGFERIGLVPLEFPKLTSIAFIIISVLAAFGVLRLEVDDSLSQLFRADTPEFNQYERLSKTFPSSEFDVLVVVEGKDLLKRESLDALRNTVLEFNLIDSINGIVSIFSARQPPERDEIPAPLFPEELPEGEAYDKLIELVRANEIIKGKLLSDDGELALIVMALDRDIVASQGLRNVIGEIRTTVEEQLESTGLKTQLSGAPVMQLEIRNAVERDGMLYNGLGFLIGATIAIFFFRHFSLMIVAAAPPALAILWSLGLLGWLDFRLNLFLSVMSPLIMVMAFSDTMQLTVAARDRLLSGDSRMEALRYAILTVGPACVVTVAAAAASFITLLVANSSLIRTFGAAGAISCFIAYIAVIVLVPLLGMYFLPKKMKASQGAEDHDRAMGFLRDICTSFSEIIVKYPLAFSLFGIFLVVLFGTAHLSLEPRYRLADQVPDREQALEASGRLDAKLTGANPIHILIEFPESASLYADDTLAVIKGVHQNVEKQSGVGNVWSVETLRRWLEEAGKPGVDILKQYIDMLPEHLVRRFISPAQNSVIVTGRIPDVDASELSPLVEKLDRSMDHLRKQYSGYEISVTGLAAIAARNSASMIQTLNLGLTAEMVFVAMIIGLAFRSLLIALVSALTGLFPIFASGTLLWLSGEGLQFASIVALTVAFGLGLDATIHYLNRLQLEDNPDEDPAIGIKRATVLVGPALILTTIVLAFGLAVTIFSDLPSLRLFGRLCAITLIAALIGDLMILPATILLVRRFTRKAGKKDAVPVQQEC